jgi:4-hydroxy-tetrahydrodipicolinate reductase
MIKIAVIGSCGRMGREIIKIIETDPSLELTGAVEHKDSPFLGSSLGSVTVGYDIDSALINADVAIDFSGAAGTGGNLKSYHNAGRPVVIGSTGFMETEKKEILSLSASIPIFMASNMSLGVSVMARLVYLAAKALDSDFNIEVFEAHHKHKKDAPSGTALTLGEAAAKGRGLDFTKAAIFSREGLTGERETDSIGFQVMRAGDIVGEHTIFFCGEGERLEIKHTATSRAIFARGALKAAKWLHEKNPGLYSMDELLGFSQ